MIPKTKLSDLINPKQYERLEAIVKLWVEIATDGQALAQEDSIEAEVYAMAGPALEELSRVMGAEAIQDLGGPVDDLGDYDGGFRDRFPYEEADTPAEQNKARNIERVRYAKLESIRIAEVALANIKDAHQALIRTYGSALVPDLAQIKQLAALSTQIKEGFSSPF